MRILLLGKNGQVGWELQRTLAPFGEVIALGRDDVDLADHVALRDRVDALAPQLIVNAAAYTAVDQAEREPELAMTINGIVPQVLAEAAEQHRAALIHYSTDYVFDGKKGSPYTEEDEPNPINVYGQSKLAGEQAIQRVGIPHLIFRTSWVYGLRGKNFLRTILKLAQEKPELKIVNDQFGAPTWCRLLAEATAAVVAQCYLGKDEPTNLIHHVSGLYHLTATGETSWYGFAEAILQQSQLSMNSSTHHCQLLAIPAIDYPTPAQRPAYSTLSNAKLSKHLGIRLPDWREHLSLALNS